MIEREKAVTFKGNPLTLLGELPAVGGDAPDCTLTTNDLADVKLSENKGKVVVLSVAPSLDTPVCATQTKTFNQKATELSDDVVILNISMDLPFAQARFCGAEGIDRVTTLSDYKNREFGEAYGVLIKELGLLSRAVFVVGRDGDVLYVEVVPEVTDEPDYDAALGVVKAEVGK